MSTTRDADSTLERQLQRVVAEEMMDPSTADGFRVLYDREVSIEIRQSDDRDEDVGQLQAIKAKILVLGDERSPDAVRVEFSSEVDLFFHYFSTMDSNGFRDMQARQKLMIDFPDYAAVLIRNLNACIKEAHTYMAVLYVNPNGTARVDFIQNMEYKFVELLSVDLIQSPQELVRQHISFRYNNMKERVAVLQTRLQDVHQLIRLKNPSLLLQIQRSPLRPAGASPQHSESSRRASRR